ncbi:PTH1 family peptidyl-tRNA hydrolase [Rhodobium orientis]|uniref:Peptidyl-tRNA hydrolase n=1 Tax=Rhodobium orientis TaxID=34017 RepID=A0A327JU44_9HYPH|nr:aminoacyl-tRNA hydrolase [Rhodobium orientis]MBB4301190.1 PTH1 family peptidyl-tRNA hydrolase [Rhodobium orientis]MBK5951217.1 aminoacyl-tRNA hydrolase [Rhodobium orientis]RAI30040.1 aminoacyl-tRNA hydrolase [Rhodobium orientis]
MFILVGLGNPGSDYADNRHNIGFMAVDAVHRRHGFSPWRRKFQAEVADGHLGSEKVLLVKPMTYMNESGRAVGEVVRFYKLQPEDVVVIHDELDLPPAKTRMKTGGGHGGHNGLRSITSQIGDRYRRLRLGIGHPGRKELVHSYVLKDFAKADLDWLEPLLDAIADNAVLLATGADSAFANKLHLALGGSPTGPKKPAKGKGGGKKNDKPEAKPDPKAADTPAEKPATADKPAEPQKRGALAEGLARLFGKHD